MALMQETEGEKEISDTSESCPQCGLPMTTKSVKIDSESQNGSTARVGTAIIIMTTLIIIGCLSYIQIPKFKRHNTRGKYFLKKSCFERGKDTMGKEGDLLDTREKH
jgi:hypothetical protein